MRIIKSYKIFESCSDIDSICREYNIENYTINNDGSIDVDGNIDLSYGNITYANKKLSKLPLKFRRVEFNFDCSDNEITTSEGLPSYVGGGFYCYSNGLSSFEGFPSHVDGDLFCDNNLLRSFEGFPNHVGGSFYCKNNPIYGIWELFEDMDKIELLNDFDIFRNNGRSIVSDRLNGFLEEIGKPSKVAGNVRKVAGYRLIR